MISRIADVLIDAADIAAILRERKQSLGERRRAGLHLAYPAGIRNGHAVQAGLARLELIKELLAVLSEQLGIEGVDRLDIRQKPRPFVADVSGADRNRVGRLMFDRQVPLLVIGQAIRVNWPVDRDELPVQESRIEERRAREILRRPVAPFEGRDKVPLRA